jgi:hypothetical protein
MLSENLTREIPRGARKIFIRQLLKILAEQRCLLKFLRRGGNFFRDAPELFERICGQIRHGSRVREAAGGVKLPGTRYNPFPISCV